MSASECGRPYGIFVTIQVTFFFFALSFQPATAIPDSSGLLGIVLAVYASSSCTENFSNFHIQATNTCVKGGRYYVHHDCVNGQPYLLFYSDSNCTTQTSSSAMSTVCSSEGDGLYSQVINCTANSGPLNSSPVIGGSLAIDYFLGSCASGQPPEQADFYPLGICANAFGTYFTVNCEPQDALSFVEYFSDAQCQSTQGLYTVGMPKCSHLASPGARVYMCFAPNFVPPTVAPDANDPANSVVGLGGVTTGFFAAQNCGMSAVTQYENLPTDRCVQLPQGTWHLNHCSQNGNPPYQIVYNDSNCQVALEAFALTAPVGQCMNIASGTISLSASVVSCVPNSGVAVPVAPKGSSHPVLVGAMQTHYSSDTCGGLAYQANFYLAGQCYSYYLNGVQSLNYMCGTADVIETEYSDTQCNIVISTTSTNFTQCSAASDGHSKFLSCTFTAPTATTVTSSALPVQPSTSTAAGASPAMVSRSVYVALELVLSAVALIGSTQLLL